MAKRTQKQRKTLSKEILYSSYKGSVYWKTVNHSISNLVKNQDIEEKTLRHYIVGYLVMNIEKCVDKTLDKRGRTKKD